MPDEKSGSPAVQIAQGYLVVADELEIRLRKAKDDHQLTFKQGHGESREETEVEIAHEAFEELWPLTEGRRISKTRNLVEIESGLTAEVDLYEGDLSEIAVVEVEFDSSERAAGFSPPGWFGRELTGDRAWANQSLALFGKPKRKLEFQLRPGEAPGSGIARVIAARTAQAAAEIRRAASEDDPAGQIHEARKSLKKARSALRLLRGVIPEEERRRANGSLRAAGAELSGARDAEVKIATLDAVVGTRAAWPALAGSFAALGAEAGTHRNALTPTRLDRTAHAVDGVRSGFAGRSIAADPEVIAGNLGRTYRRGRQAMERAAGDGGPEDFHAWRKRAKDLRYQLEILRGVLPKAYKPIRKNARQLTDLLGDTHDLDVLLEDLGRRDIDPEAWPGIVETISFQRDGLTDESIRLGRATYAQKPRRFTRDTLSALANVPVDGD